MKRKGFEKYHTVLFNILCLYQEAIMNRSFYFLLVLFFASSASAQSFYKETPEARHWVDSVFKKLSRKERIAQLMVVRLSERTADGVVFHDEEVEEAVNKYNIGAICLFQGNPVQQANYINHFQSIAETPLMICIDGETGLGMRMTDSVVKFPDQLTLGALPDAALVYKIGKAIGEQCRRAGIQVNYAPVVDINNNPDNPVINFRSFGEDKYKVALLGTQMMKGIQSEGVLACAKHFPGHGDVSIDSHKDLPEIDKSFAQLDSLELYPFKTLFKEGVGSVMMAHLYIPAIDTIQNQPASLSQKNVTGLLRYRLGYFGISFTDALEMQGVAKYFKNGDASLQSLIAGNDMLCLPGDIEGSINEILKAIRKGILNREDIDARVKKVLLVKYHLGLNNVKQVETENLTTDLNAKVNGLRTEVAANAITLLRLANPELLPLKKTSVVAYVAVGINYANTLAGLLQKNYNADVFYFDYKADEQRAKKLFDSLQAKYDVVIIGMHRYNKYPANNYGISDAAIKLITQIQQSKPSLTLVFGNPYAIKQIEYSPNLAACYEDDSIFQKAAFDFIDGKIFAKGTLPVTVSDELKFGSGITENAQLPLALPETVGFKKEKIAKIDSLANDAIAKHATPGCVVLVAKDGKIAYYKSYGYKTYDSTEPVTPQTVYDLASVTKISATTVSVMKLYEEGKLDITKTLGDYLPWVTGTDKANLVLENILLHQAGLDPFIPFYKETIDTATGIPMNWFYQALPDETFSIRVADEMFMRKDFVDTMYARILTSPLGPPNKYVYSDNDFIFLGKVIEQITGETLDEYARETFYQPLQMTSTTFKPNEHEPLDLIAPAEEEKLFRLQLLRGDVHDPGAAMFGGVSGHAGLFSNAYDLAKLYQLLLNGGELNGVRLLKKETIDYFTAYHSNVSRRGFGFDKPEKDNATRPDPYPSLSASPQTFGHTGYTGTCVWADPKYNLLFIFLSNRVNPDGGTNLKLSELKVRQNILETVYQSLIDKQR